MSNKSLWSYDLGKTTKLRRDDLLQAQTARSLKESPGRAGAPCPGCGISTFGFTRLGKRGQRVLCKAVLCACVLAAAAL
jgi:hypothetical protein